MSTPPVDPTSILQRLETFGVRLGLDRIRALLAALGAPHSRLATVLVAGTNGKGSTSALLESILRRGGYRTGLYTSPHLESVTERIRVDGRAVTSDQLGALLERVLQTTDGPDRELPTYFEALTAAGLLWFSDCDVDVAILETGLGGRLDATNATEPMLSIVTSIGLDHEAQLGSTLAAIAREKGGIFRRDRPAIVWGGESEVRDALVSEAARCGARLVVAEDLVTVEHRRSADGRRLEVSLSTAGDRSYRFGLDLVGDHQARNAAMAVLAAEQLSAAGWRALDRETIESGLEAAVWPGRLEWVDLPMGGAVLLDCAHNPPAVTALLRALDEEPFTLLFGALGDKRAELMLPPLAARAARVVLTEPPSPRAVPVAELEPFAGSAVRLEPDVGEALAAALGGGERRLLVTGSIFLVGDVRRRLREIYGVPRALDSLALPELIPGSPPQAGS